MSSHTSRTSFSSEYRHADKFHIMFAVKAMYQKVALQVVCNPPQLFKLANCWLVDHARISTVRRWSLQCRFFSVTLTICSRWQPSDMAEICPAPKGKRVTVEPGTLLITNPTLKSLCYQATLVTTKPLTLKARIGRIAPLLQ